MATSKLARTKPKGAKAQVGLLAMGTSGPWEVAIDEVTSGPERWFAQVEGPLLSFCFEIPSLDFVEKAIQFLDSKQQTAEHSTNGSPSKCEALSICSKKGTPAVTLVRDDEYADRLFVVIGKREDPLVRLVLADVDLEHIRQALGEVRNDLHDSLPPK